MAKKKEWLIRKAKRYYIGPFTSDEVKKLIRESELSTYDEIAKAGGTPWRYLKDCTPFISLIEEVIPHAEEEKTVRLDSEEATAITEPGATRKREEKKIPKLEKRLTSQPVIDLRKKKQPVKKRAKRPWTTWLGGGAVLVVLAVAVGRIVLEKSPEEASVPESPVEGRVSEPKLKELADTFRQFNLLFYQGKIEESAGEFSKAVQLYKQALKYNPKDIKAKIRLAALKFVYEKNSEGARRDLIKLSADRTLKMGQASEIQNYLGLLELKKNNFVGAASLFKKAIRFDNSYAPAQFNLGYSYFFQKQYYNAKKHFDRAVQLQPNLPLIYLYLGRTLQKLNKDKAAVREYTNASRINPNLYLPYLYLSFIQFKLKKRDKALAYIAQMIKRDPEYDQNTFKDHRYVQEALSYSFIIKVLSVISKERKPSSQVLAGLALLHYLDGSTAHANTFVQRAIRQNPADETAHTVQGYILQKEGNLKGALSSLNTALRHQYQNVLAHTLIADIDIRLGRYQEAVERCRKVLSFEPFSVRAYYVLGVALTYLDRVSEGIDAFNKALEYDPSYIPAKKKLLQHTR